MYLANRKRFLIAYLDNMKAVEMPRSIKKEEITDSETSSSSSSSSGGDSLDSDYEEDVVLSVEKIGFEIPDRLRNFTSLQYYKNILVIGGMHSYYEDSRKDY